ncbi:hypothetical protein HOL21_01840 [Candidatus Woesearchaeota archaeon]|jgi:uncharacterized protein with PQ loop repeat|nr:hypothetical protein [Candidatus Woesearchaeota archaeon]MBT5396935.1 hypothetical protein [Candidatus Woesearchaeota archaeon]MBT5924899.1 hypothetical protein [Candidatus Woesearchaeota archaeon]MBT6367128.1 hypothetical protein [Candidatus Woesearchaeota archaeon]MBT7762298.1 hypothetical protein [Candidatus Woesearchaeota archaeon]
MNLGNHHHLHKRKRVHQKLKKFPHPNKWIRFLDRLLLIVAVIGPVMSLPQVYKIYYYQSAAGISIMSFALLAVLNIPWIAYGFVHKDKPIIISSFLWIISNIVVVIGAITYG